MSNDIFEELEKAINEEFKVKGLDIEIEIKGFKNGFSTNLSRTELSADERRKLNEAISIAWDKMKIKWFREF